MRSREGRQDAAEDATLRVVQQHAAELLQFARRFSHCADDAHDAYQRALEILVRRMRVDPPAAPLPWLRTVLRHEALAVRSERERLVGRTEVDLDRHEDRGLDDPADRVVGRERLRHTAEALRRLKPQEVTALVLRAEGLSYAEICARMGWTYTKTNRCVTEGRRALLERLGAIESGAECSRWLPLLSALADGEASADDLVQLRPHLRSCPACRATLRELHAVPSQLSLLVPPVVVEAGARAPHGSLLGHVESGLHALVERATLLASRLQGGLEALPGAKLAAVAASTAALATGGVAIERASHARPAASATRAVASDIGRLTPSGPLPRPAAVRRTRRNPTGGEFAARPVARAEFAARAAPRAEFAGDSPAAASPSDTTARSASDPAALAPAAAPAAAGGSPEFGGP